MLWQQRILLRFPTHLPFQSPYEYGELIEEYHDYQLKDETEIPPNQISKFQVERGTGSYMILDKLWHYLGSLTNVDGTERFPRLKKIARLILTIPHSNAEERIFSIIRKNKTCFHPNLDPNKTLGSLVTVKLAMNNESVSKFKLDKELLASAKQATRKYNKQHSN